MVGMVNIEHLFKISVLFRWHFRLRLRLRGKLHVGPVRHGAEQGAHERGGKIWITREEDGRERWVGW